MLFYSAMMNNTLAHFGKKQTEVQIANLGSDAGIIGAVLLWENRQDIMKLK